MKYILIVLFICGRTAAQNSISSAKILHHIEVFGNDSLQGRGTGTHGCTIAAQYIARQLHAYGIIPAPHQPDFFQTFPLHGSSPLTGTSFTLFTAVDTIPLQLHQQYVLYTTGEQTFIPSPVPLIFVGYGIIAPEYDYNDYLNVNVENAIVVFLSGEPVSSDSMYFDGGRPTIHSSITLKQKIALARGARGSIIIPNPRDAVMNNWEEQNRQFLFEESQLLYHPASNLNILLNPLQAQLLFRSAKYSFYEIETMDKKGLMQSFPLATQASFQGKFSERDFLSSNVIGMIEGSDPGLKETFLLVTAHYDHLGIGPALKGDSVYNGVFDNAGGVAALLEIAHSLQQHRVKTKRSILFAFLTGEERGFLGSQYYCLNPVVPLYKTIANINIDGIAMFDTFNSITGIGREFSTLGEDLDTVAKKFFLNVEDPPAAFLDVQPFSNSDQFIFAQAGIPSILVMEGLNYRNTPYEQGLDRFIHWGRDIYHSPFDDLHQTLNMEAAVEHAEILKHYIEYLANSDREPQWHPGSIFINARLQTKAEKR